MNERCPCCESLGLTPVEKAKWLINHRNMTLERTHWLTDPGEEGNLPISMYAVKGFPGLVMNDIRAFKTISDSGYTIQFFRHKNNLLDCVEMVVEYQDGALKYYFDLDARMDAYFIIKVMANHAVKLFNHDLKQWLKVEIFDDQMDWLMAALEEKPYISIQKVSYKPV